MELREVMRVADAVSSAADRVVDYSRRTRPGREIMAGCVGSA
ncbi:hypothetical protein [Frankia sp. QA3]|nr:hypothetical protein [Frankia sp. QA3]